MRASGAMRTETAKHAREERANDECRRKKKWPRLGQQQLGSVSILYRLRLQNFECCRRAYPSANSCRPKSQVLLQTTEALSPGCSSGQAGKTEA